MRRNVFGYPSAAQPEDSRPFKRPRNWQATDVVEYKDSAVIGPQASQPRTPGERASVLDASSYRLQEKERGRRLSCKECRRLKLKCDRVFPCQSCRKRGCSDICPEGCLISGRGSRFILANTEQLHDKIQQLSERVRQLEDALKTSHSDVSIGPHPLLTPELLRIKTSQELYGPSHNQRSFFASNVELTAAQRDDALGAFVGALTLNPVPEEAEHGSSSSNWREASPPEVPPDILQLSATFPFPWAVDLKIRKRIRNALPPREQAMAICQEARSNALWQYNLDATETFLPNLLHHCYTSAIEDLSPRRLALLLMILSIGSLVDLNRPLGCLHGEAYHHLARASVCEIPLMEEPDFDVLHALFFMIWYHLIFSDNNKAVGYAWNLMGFVAKLAQGLGLHRDGSRQKLIPEEHEKRRLVFWELLNMDCRMSLSLGRPPSICLAHVDIKPPSYRSQGLYVPEEEIVYHEWKNAFFVKHLSPILEVMIAVSPPSYERIMELDSGVRIYGIPALFEEDSGHDITSRFLIMQRAVCSTGRDIALLQLHRRYFTEAMNEPVGFDFNHKYAPSVLATYLGASSLIAAVETAYEKEPQLTARFLCFWFNAFSAAVMLSLFISRAPSCALAPIALKDLDRVCRLFRKAGQILPFSGRSLPLMEKLADKSRRVLLQWRNSGDQSMADLGEKYQLPSAFLTAHPFLRQHAERITVSPQSPVIPPTPSRMPQRSLSDDAWLPDIYHFNSNGIDVTERYTLATAQPTPFMPSSPRVDDNESFNFDHGALTADIEDTSYMAWF